MIKAARDPRDSKRLPVLKCDECGNEIRRSGEGLALYAVPDQVRFLHKGNCEKRYCATHPDEDGWDEIDVFLNRLAARL